MIPEATHLRDLGSQTLGVGLEGADRCWRSGYRLQNGYSRSIHIVVDAIRGYVTRKIESLREGFVDIVKRIQLIENLVD
jgi:hypothetical protein